jgi:phosphoglycolate phosphatase-like HAD superfamily hydrolase
LARVPSIVALDFDGVICDSFEECLRIAHGAYQRFERRDGHCGGAEEVDREFEARFRRWRHLVRPAREYWALCDLVARGQELSPARFARARQRAESTGVLGRFEPVFFAERDQLRREQPERWASLHRLYPQFLAGWPDLRRRATVHVVTTKDRSAVEALDAALDIGLDHRLLWTRDEGLGKPAAIRAIAAAAHVPASAVCFVDDHPEHLLDVAPTGAQRFWAAWGYTPGDETQGLGRDVHRLDDLAQLSAWLE